MMQPTILTSSGSYFNLLAPSPYDISIDDIAHALSHICRFTGHVREFYSVAQHSYHASYLVPSEHALAALLHDAAEAYVGDVASPLKRLLPDYKSIEARVEAAVCSRFYISLPLDPCVKQADLIMLATEKRDLMPWMLSDNWEILNDISPEPKKLVPMSPPVARHVFMTRFFELINLEAEPCQ